MNNEKELEKGAYKYIDKLKKFFPNIKLPQDDDLMNIYVNISYIYDLCAILLSFDYITDEWFKTMINEYAEFNAKILITIVLKDRNLVNCYLRMLTEKLYRLIYIQFKHPKTKSKIRRKTQKNIYNELKETSAKKSLDKIYPLFDKYSKEIHNYEHHEEDLYSVVFGLEEKDFELSDYLTDIKILNEVFEKEIFKKHVNTEESTVAIKKRLSKYESFRKDYS